MESLVMFELDKLDSYYRGKKVFVTGHTGFKGSWLIYWLKQLGAIVHGYSLEPEKESLYRSVNGDSLIDNSFFHDINNYEEVSKKINNFKPDYIFHLAAQPLVLESYEQPLKTFNTNVIGTANILNSLFKLNKKCSIIIVTTDKVYENNEFDHPFKENDRLGGYDPYSSSKAASELVVNSYIKSFFNIKYYNKHQKSISTVRAGNVIGGGDWSKNRLIPDLVKSFSKNISLEVRSPDSVRPWQHVLEPLASYLFIAAKSYNEPQFSRPWNIGPYSNQSLSVRKVVDIANKFWPEGSVSFPSSTTKLHEANILKLDISDALNILRWEPKMDIDLTIERTINWYKQFYNGESSLSLMKKDLDFYINL